MKGLTLVFLSFLALSPSAFSRDGAPTAVRVTHGPMLGRPEPRSMTLWFRTDRPGPVNVLYGTHPDKLDQRATLETTVLDHDNTGLLTIDDLESNTRYHYRVEDHQLSGSFKTLKRPADFRNPQTNPEGLFNFRFEFACGNNQGGAGDSAGPALPVYDTLNREVRDTIDFAVLNGDWLYEDRRETPVEEWRSQVGIAAEEDPWIVSLAPSIVGVWENYKIYLERGRNLSEWHRHVPSFYTYDDHETLNDIYGTGETGYVNRRAVFRDIGVRAWFHYLAWSNPVAHDVPSYFGLGSFEEDSPQLRDPNIDFTQFDFESRANLHVHWGTDTAGVKDVALDSQPGDPNAGVYAVEETLDAHTLRLEPAARATGEAAYSIGRRAYGKWSYGACDFFFVDTRSHRDLHDVENPDKPGASMLGKQQLAWLKEGIQASEAQFIFVVSSVNFMVPHVGSGGGDDKQAGIKKDDAWTVFLEEREELIEFWDGLETPVFVLTGDLHNSFAVKITDNVWEFASGPHNSINHAPENDEGNRPANGLFQYGPRPCEIRWSTYVMSDIPRAERQYPTYCVVQVNNVFNNPLRKGDERWVAYPHPQVIFQFFDAFTGDLRYSETIVSGL